MNDHKETMDSGYNLESNPSYLGFQKVEVTKVDETKPWKPALEVKVTKADGTDDTIDADTSFFTFTDSNLKKLHVTAAAAGHVDDLHIKGTDAGSKFSHSSLEELMEDVAEKLPEGIANTPGPHAFAMEMGKNMGKEGIATLEELKSKELVDQADIDKAMAVKEEVFELNKSGDEEDRNAFVAKFKEENPDNNVQFQVIREGAVIVPVVDAPKQDTTELFMVFGPGALEGKVMYTAAPGRYMPRHPNPVEFREEEGGIEGEAYKEAQEAWFNTVMLTGKEVEEATAEDVAEETSKEASDTLDKMKLTASFEELAEKIPEVKAMVDFDQKSDYHSLTADEHTKKAVRTLEADEFISNHPKRDLILLAMKLHDVGKPHPEGHQPKKNDPDKLGFLGHEKLGKELVSKILPQYFEVDEKDAQLVESLVGLHASALNLVNNFQSNSEPKGKALKSYDKFIAEVEKIPGDMSIEEKMRIVFAINKADKSGGWNEESDMEDEKVKAIVEKAEAQLKTLAELENALPALLEAVKARRAGDQKAGIKKVGDAYVYEKPEAESAKVEIPVELKRLGKILKDKMKVVAEVYPKLKKLAGNEKALNGLLKGKCQLNDEQLQAVVDLLNS